MVGPSITAPGLFPYPKRFVEQYARPIERGGDAEELVAGDLGAK